MTFLRAYALMAVVAVVSARLLLWGHRNLRGTR